MEGKFIVSNLNGKFVACETSCEITFENELLPASAIYAGRWREYIDGVRSWALAVNANTVLGAAERIYVPELLQMFLEGGEVGVAFQSTHIYNGLLTITGQALVRSGGIQAPSSGESTWNVIFQGNGPLEYVYEPFSQYIINAMPIGADKDLTVDTTKWE